MKFCPKCKTSKLISDFCKHIWCKACRAEYQSQWRLKNLEKEKIYHQTYFRKLNPNYRPRSLSAGETVKRNGEILKLLLTFKYPQSVIAKEFGVSMTVISGIWGGHNPQPYKATRDRELLNRLKKERGQYE